MWLIPTLRTFSMTPSVLIEYLWESSLIMTPYSSIMVLFKSFFHTGSSRTIGTLHSSSLLHVPSPNLSFHHSTTFHLLSRPLQDSLVFLFNSTNHSKTVFIFLINFCLCQRGGTISKISYHQCKPPRHVSLSNHLPSIKLSHLLSLTHSSLNTWDHTQKKLQFNTQSHTGYIHLPANTRIYTFINRHPRFSSIIYSPNP